MSQKTNITIDQGTTFVYTFSVLDTYGDPMDLTNYTATSQMRKSYSSSNATTFTCTTANGEVIISLSANQTSNIVAGRYVYDIELTAVDGVVTRQVEGIVTVTPQVTR